MNAFVNSMNREVNSTVTEKGHYALSTTGSYLLDLYGIAGGMRERPAEDITSLFEAGFREDPRLAMKLMFYIRDVRGGVGERRTGKLLMTYVANKYPDIMIQVIPCIPFYGRWDDLYSLVGTPVQEAAIELIKLTLLDDKKNKDEGKSISLCAKWAKSINSRRDNDKRLAKLTAEAMGLKPGDYRRLLSELRAYLDVVEVKMSSKKFDKINYSAVPSRAMMKYRKAFIKWDERRFDEFIDAVNEGKTTINTGAITPFDIVSNLSCTDEDSSEFKLLETQWTNLPNYVETGENILVMADTSGSMYGRPLEVALGLALYFAERNHGAFQNYMMTFASNPKFHRIDPTKNLKERWDAIPEIIDSTNFYRAYEAILEVGKRDNVPNEDMPKYLLVISDMEFDCSVCGPTMETTYEEMKRRFKEEGYDLPGIIFWDVAARSNHFQASTDNANCQLASGESIAVFKSVIEALNMTPYEAMIKTLTGERYEMVNPQIIIR